MQKENLDSLRFPIGTYQSKAEITQEDLNDWIKTLEEFPEKLGVLLKEVSQDQLQWRYRPGGWTIKQLVHHCADSHMNSLMRFKLALTEDKPIIRPYDEAKWAELEDSLNDDLTHSILLIQGLHAKWVQILKSLNKEQLELQFVHPEHGKTFSIYDTIGTYAWHCHHHLAHLKNALNSQGQYTS